MSLHSRSLTNYEKEEIREHEKIYYVGSDCQKRPASREVVANNHGYDDDRGDYLLVPHDHILYRYEVIDVLGKGSFGQVLQCRDHRTGDMVAIKIIRNKKRFHQQALVEIKVLENLVKWVSVLRFMKRSVGLTQLNDNRIRKIRITSFEWWTRSLLEVIFASSPNYLASTFTNSSKRIVSLDSPPRSFVDLLYKFLNLFHYCVNIGLSTAILNLK
jgi:serine/threonine protein kinase